MFLGELHSNFMGYNHTRMDYDNKGFDDIRDRLSARETTGCPRDPAAACRRDCSVGHSVCLTPLKAHLKPDLTSPARIGTPLFMRAYFQTGSGECLPADPEKRFPTCEHIILRNPSWRNADIGVVIVVP